MWESLLAFLDVAFDVFDYHDGVVHHQSGGQRDAEQSKRVDRKSQQLDEGKSSDQRYRNGHRGNNGAAPVREKNKDDENDQNDGLDKCGEHVPDRFAYGLGRIERILILHAGREMLGQPVQFGQDQAVHFESVRGRELGNAETDRVVTVVHQV